MATAVIMPRQGQSVESCILVEWMVASGDKVVEGQPLASIETDKAVFEVESPAAGTVVELFFEPGSDIPVLMNIAAIGEAGEDVSGLRPGGAGSVDEPPVPSAPAADASPAAAGIPAVAAAPAPAGGTGAVSPRARNLARQTGMDVSVLAGSGPGGRVIERDVKQAAAGMPRMTGAAKEAMAVGGVSIPAAGSGLAGMVRSSDLKAGAVVPAAVAAVPAASTEIPVTGIRKLIADRMKSSLATTAQLTLTRSFDATAILAYREKLKKQADALGLPNITINDMIVYATARTLKRFPALNAHCLGNKVVQFGRVNMGVAMDTPRGLMVPVLSGADGLSLAGIAQGTKPMSDAAREGNINPDLLKGGTFTITNMGMLGVEVFTPILNAPEVAILGVGGLVLKPVMDGDAVKHVKAITLSLTIDHQVVDGGPGARFLQSLATMLENFELALAE